MLRKTKRRNLSKRKKVDVKINLKKLYANVNPSYCQNEGNDQETASTSLETFVSTVNNPATINDSANEDNICPDIAHLTNEDIDELINDVNSFINDGALDGLMCDEDLSSSSNLNVPTLPVSDIIESVNSSSSELNVSALDLSIITDILPLTLKTEPINFIQHDCEFPLPHLPIPVKTVPENRLVDENYSTKIQSTKTSYLTEQKEKIHQETDKGFKMSVVILEEILGLQGLQPTYDLVHNQVTNISQIFEYRVWFNEQDANGVGKSIEHAQNSAARSLLDKLATKKYFGNKIGALQELCMARHLPLPVYEHEMEIHSRDGHDFIVSCKVLEFKEFGQGSNKKIAKLFAAYKMMNCLKNIN